jgi:hypothetical protein
MVATALCAGSCGRSAGPGSGSGVPATPAGDPASAVREVDDFAAALASVGRRVRVRGTAQNDKLSAVVEAHGLAVYCLDLEGWPTDQVGKVAAIEGTLERTDEFAARPSASDGLASQGATGSVFVIRRCTVVR